MALWVCEHVKHGTRFYANVNGINDDDDIHISWWWYSNLNQPNLSDNGLIDWYSHSEWHRYRDAIIYDHYWTVQDFHVNSYPKDEYFQPFKIMFMHIQNYQPPKQSTSLKLYSTWTHIKDDMNPRETVWESVNNGHDGYVVEYVHLRCMRSSYVCVS